MKKRGYSSFLIKTIMLLLALIVMAVVASVAWFIDGDAPAKASGLSVSTQTEVDFDIAIGFQTTQTDNKYIVSDFEKQFNLRDLKIDVNNTPNDESDDEKYDIFYDFSPLDVTGDGVTLVRPKLTYKNSQIDTKSGSYSDVDPNQDYISFDMLIRSNQECTLYLDKGSKAYGKAEITNGSLYYTEPQKPTDDENYNGDTVVSSCDINATDNTRTFSPDAIVGALRVAFTDVDDVDYITSKSGEESFDENTQPKALWIPRSDIRFEQNDTTNSMSLYSNITSIDKVHDIYSFYNIKRYDKDIGDDDIPDMNTYTHHYYSYKKDESDKIVGYTPFAEAITIHELNKDKIPICEVNKRIEGDDENYYGKVHVNIWVEGCDSEARRALRGGEFIINFDIKSGDAVEESTEETQTQE